MGSCISVGGGGGGKAMSYATFCTWGKGDKGDKILTCYIFDPFTLSLSVH